MSALKIPIARAVVRPQLAHHVRLSAPRSRAATDRMLYTTTARNQQKINSDGIEDQDPIGGFNKEGTKSSTNYAIIGGATLVLGAAFWMLLAKPDKVAKEAINHDPNLVPQKDGVKPQSK